VRRLDVVTGNVSTLAGWWFTDGIGTSSTFANPQGIAMNAAGTVAVVVDSTSQVARRIDLESGNTSTLAGVANAFGHANGAGSASLFRFPNGVALDGQGLFALIVSIHLVSCKDTRKDVSIPPKILGHVKQQHPSCEYVYGVHEDTLRAACASRLQ